jgi:ketosteroid isomerase-like protein
MNARTGLLLLLGLVSGACGAPQQVDLEAEGEALMQLSREWSDLVTTAPVDEWIGFWAEDAVMMPPDLPPLRGRAAIREYVEAGTRIPGFHISWAPEEVHVAESGDLAYMIERNVATLNDSVGNPITTHGKVVTVWRKDPDGSWRNVVDIWNTAPPPRDQ